MEKPGNPGVTRIRPFVGGKEVAPVDARTFAYTPPRPFAFTGRHRPLKSPTSTSSLSFATAQKSPTPLWTVAVYEPGMDRGAFNDPPRVLPAATNDVVDASLALADDVIEAQRHAASLAAADVLEAVARQMRRGEILLLPGASTQSDAAVLSSVLAAVIGGRR